MIKLNTKTLYVRTRAEKDIKTNRYSGIRIRSQLGKYVYNAGKRNFSVNFEHIDWDSQNGSNLPPFALSGVPVVDRISEGESFDFKVVLMGKAVPAYLHFAAAIRFGRFFTLGDAQDGLPGKVLVEDVYDRFGNPITAGTDDRDDPILIPKNVHEIRIVPLSPLLLKSSQKRMIPDLQDITPGIIALNMLNRLESLNSEPVLVGFPLERYLHDHFGRDVRMTSLRQDGVSFSNVSMRFDDLDNSVSSSSFFVKPKENGTKIDKRGGILNPITLRGNLSPILPLILAGERLGIGRATAFGMGSYRVEILDGARVNDLVQYKNRLVNRQNLYKSIELDEILTEKRLKEAKDDFNEGEYIVKPAIRFHLESGRELSLIDPLDKLLEMHATEYLYRHLDSLFGDFIYAFRRGKGAKKAIKRIRHEIDAQKLNYALKLDIDKFFDSIDRDILMTFLKQNHICNRIRKFTETSVSRAETGKGKLIELERGIPQGAVISPVLSNLYLKVFDEYIADHFKGVFYTRYCDDLLFLGKTGEVLEKIQKDLPEYNKRSLGLSFNDTGKIVILSKQAIDYLGISISKDTMKMSEEKHTEKAADLLDIWQKHKKEPEYATILMNVRFERWREYYGAVLEKNWTAEHNRLLDRLLLLDKNTELISLVNSLRPVQVVEKQIKKAQRELSVKEILQKSKQEYLETTDERASLVIDTDMTFLGRRDFKVYAKCDGKCSYVPVQTLKEIVISADRGISISGSLIQLLAENDVTVSFLDFSGEPYAYIIPPQGISRVQTNSQLRSFASEKGFVIAKEIILCKMINQLHLVRYWAKSRKGEIKSEMIMRAEKIEEMIQRVKTLEFHNELNYSQRLMHMEALAAAHYWKVFALAIKKYDFPGRRRKGAKDPINSMLNYGYGWLKNEVHRCLSAEGLDVTISYIHKNYRKKASLVFDLMEQFRQPIIDREVASIANKGMEIEVENGLLTDKSRRYIIDRFVKRFAKTTVINDNIYSNKDLIKENISDFLAYLQDRKSDFKGYVWHKW